MLENVTTGEQAADSSYVDMQNLELRLLLTANHYTNPNSFHLCFPIKIKKLTNKNNNIDKALITVNNFFTHWLKKINVTRYSDYVQLFPTSSPYHIYQYSHLMLKHLPEKSLKTIEELLLYIKKRVSYTGNIDRRLNNSDTPADITDDNIDNRITKFVDVINNEKVYRIPLRYFCNLGKIDYPVKINLKITCLLETNIKNLFELKKKSAVAGTPDAKIIFANAPHIQYKQFKLNNNCRQYIKTIVSSSKVLRMRIEKALLQKTFGRALDLKVLTLTF